MRVLGRLVDEQVLDDHAFHVLKAGNHVLGVRVRLGDVLAMDVNALKRATDGLVEHVRDAETRLVLELHTPDTLVKLAGRSVGDVAVARELVGERAHVTGALHVVLAAQRIDADALAADIASPPSPDWPYP